MKTNRFLQKIWWRLYMQLRHSWFGLRPHHPCIIVMLDGGICSQMHQCLLGKIMKKRGVIKYDLDWYRRNGKDMNGVAIRNFELLKAFPNLEFVEPSKEEARFYIKNYFYSDASDDFFIGIKSRRNILGDIII